MYSVVVLNMNDNLKCSCVRVYDVLNIQSTLTYSNWQLFEVLGYSKQFSLPLVNLPLGKLSVIRTPGLFEPLFYFP